ncbi:molybdate ABC transporter substrate-binding protein [Nocardiopsis gilva YIM 90087]|uniref:Molybdate ABC transporter substrate-binding protein n=1 Tax=Nocardiopsis gilva YIM 90087 TaxID=1235441 RepID=A0A223S2K6_9ACTN|nr:molybdate ABC transporter substrate-binding protein [Nocardiopsis gilva]ASU82362.1 molybdate ABC transporter substrate-binding protein [Nocardiopsis gilva YIM 90087]
MPSAAPIGSAARHAIAANRVIAAPLLAGALLASAAACGGADGSADDGGATLTVFAAASLTDTFTELGQRFEDTHPGTTVDFNFAGSSTLAQQIDAGAPADVFASANPATMDQVVDGGRTADPPAVFARNTLRIAVPPGNPAGVEGLDDLADPDVTVALCAEQVPCGAAARTALDAAGVEVVPSSEEEDVRAALTKVTLGEVDAALVYATDIIAAGDAVEGVDVAVAEEAVNDYPIAPLSDASEPELARSWIDLVRSPEGEKVLSDAGFRTA